jgi:hypothetical protein
VVVAGRTIAAAHSGAVERLYARWVELEEKQR